MKYQFKAEKKQKKKVSKSLQSGISCNYIINILVILNNTHQLQTMLIPNFSLSFGRYLKKL